MTVKIRQATLNDAAAIAGVHVDSWRTTSAHILPHAFLAGLSYERQTSSWASALSDPEEKQFIFVADHPAEGIVGFASGGPERSGMPGDSGELRAIYLIGP